MLAIAPRVSASANVGIARPTLRRWESRRGQLGVVRAAGDDELATEVDVSVFRFTLGNLQKIFPMFVAQLDMERLGFGACKVDQC